MNLSQPFGLYLYQKERQDQQVLRDLLQLLKTSFQGKSSAFVYISSENSLLPHLTLWENLQLVSGHGSWREYSHSVKPEWNSLVRLISRPDLLARDAENWEKFTISLLKGLMGPGHLLLDMNEDHLSPFIIQKLKHTVLALPSERHIFLATALSGLWLDCAHTLVTRKDYHFISQKLDHGLIKRHWAA